MKGKPYHEDVYLLDADGQGPFDDYVLQGVIVAGDGSNNGSVSLYEGSDTGGRLIVTVRVAANVTRSVSFGEGRLCRGGVYADLTDVDHVVLIGDHFEPEL